MTARRGTTRPATARRGTPRTVSLRCGTTRTVSLRCGITRRTVARSGAARTRRRWARWWHAENQPDEHLLAQQVNAPGCSTVAQGGGNGVDPRPGGTGLRSGQKPAEQGRGPIRLADQFDPGMPLGLLAPALRCRRVNRDNSSPQRRAQLARSLLPGPGQDLALDLPGHVVIEHRRVLVDDLGPGQVDRSRG